MQSLLALSTTVSLMIKIVPRLLSVLGKCLWSEQSVLFLPQKYPNLNAETTFTFILDIQWRKTVMKNIFISTAITGIRCKSWAPQNNVNNTLIINTVTFTLKEEKSPCIFNSLLLYPEGLKDNSNVWLAFNLANTFIAFPFTLKWCFTSVNVLNPMKLVLLYSHFTDEITKAEGS